MKAQPNTLTQNKHGRHHRTAQLASRFASIVLAILLAFAMSFSAFALDSEGVSGGVSNAEHVDGALARANENADATEQDAAKEVEDSPSAQNDNSAAGKATITFTGKGKDDLPLIEDTDYTLSYDNNVNVGQATVTLKHSDDSNVTDSKTVTFNIVTADMTKAKVAAVPSQVYAGAAITPALDVSLDGVALKEGRDYAVAWENNTNVGTARGTITGIEPYCKGAITVEFQITPKPVTVTADALSKTYGDADPALTATVAGTVGADSVSYTLARESGEDVGKYAITVSGSAMQGNYAVTYKGGTLTINPASITEAAIAPIDAVVYDGAAFEPAPVIAWNNQSLVRDGDYTLSYSANVNAGRATVSVQGIGNFKDEVNVHFDILPLDVRGDGCDAVVPFKVYTGLPLEPHPARVTAPGRDGAVLELAEGTDYEVVSWRDNVNVGTGYVTIRGTGNFCETREDSFNIVNDGDLSQGYLDDIPDQTYTGGPLEPALRVYLNGVDLWLERDVNYTATFADNVNAGIASVRVTGIEDINGSLSGTFTILPADFTQTAVVAAPDRVYDGTAQEPEPTVSWNEMLLEEGRDYEVVSYADNVHAGTATVTVKGIGNFTGEAVGAFAIAKRPLSVTADSASKIYDGSPLTASGFSGDGLAAGDEVSSALVEGAQTDAGSSANKASDAHVVNAAEEDVTRDYDISYRDGTLVVEPANLGESSRFTIAPIPAADYDGKAQTPKPVIRDAVTREVLVEGSDYTLSYRNNTEVGTATVILTGRGNYAGTTSATFDIAKHVIRYTLVKGPNGPIDAKRNPTAVFEFKRSEDDEATLDHFKSVAVDGHTLGKSDYTVRKGSVIISLAPAYLKKLSSGSHVLTATFDDGSATAVFKIANAKPNPNPKPAPSPTPRTGDFDWRIVAALAVVALGAGLLAIIARRHRVR